MRKEKAEEEVVAENYWGRLRRRRMYGKRRVKGLKDNREERLRERIRNSEGK